MGHLETLLVLYQNFSAQESYAKISREPNFTSGKSSKFLFRVAIYMGSEGEEGKTLFVSLGSTVDDAAKNILAELHNRGIVFAPREPKS